MSLNKCNIIIKNMFQILCLLVVASIFSACAHQEDAKPGPSEDHDKQNDPPSQPEVTWKLPIEIPEGEFYKVGGWYSDHHLLYITNLEQSSSVYLYNLLTGNSELLYKSEVPIVGIQASPSKKNILIQSSPSTYEGQVTILSSEGSVIYTQSIPSYELAFEWNPFNESQILISSFNEDWTFQMLLLDIEQRRTTELTLPQPFIKWIGNEEVAYLNWNEDSPSLVAPLISKNLSTDTEEEIANNVLQFATYNDILMTVSIKDEEQLQASYSFYDKNKKELNSFSIPHLSMFSGWLVPYNDLNAGKREFITLKPLKSAEADAYREGFELVSFDMNNGNSKVILDNLKNEPILLSPSGNAVLYGNRFEVIIDLKTKELRKLVVK
ncbi:hypothetical protein [Neobacillus sp. DY30]|uniref:YqgU-like beta propeller domain-containing protein n=1 Tax=Neobacillus sp. DY30 TaxID=3047871 RepID=UPI0024C0C0E9|nr:hypothetical protein [Neobacillus sp. DY30]WHX99311.1 hypothetical protein QNH29_22370 [Neobacillus sp. DY30]